MQLQSDPIPNPKQVLHTVPVSMNGSTLAKAVREHYQTSWNQSRKWIETGKVFHNDKRVTESTVPVRTGDTIELRMNAPRHEKKPQLDSASVVYLDDSIIVINKPSGIMTVPFEGIVEDTLDAQVGEYLKAITKQKTTAYTSLGIVHRIDKETSGLIVFTRTWAAKENLSLQFREHSIHREYRALVHGHIQSRTIESELVRDRGDGRRGSVDRAREKGHKIEGLVRKSITHVIAKEHLDNATLIACRLETGRTHQIRIHLSECGHPLLGENQYTRFFKGQWIPAPRIMLHAAELGFTHPKTGERMRWEQPLPCDFAECLQSLRVSKAV
jgi:23S rRNA pseudouridine1911/1915/1917 synthase